MESPSSQNERLIKKMTNEVVDQIGRQIEQKMFGVSDQKRDVDKILEEKTIMKKKLSQKDNKKTKTQKINIEDLQQIKQSKIVELKQLERTQSIMKRSKLMNNSNVSRSFSKLQRSRFTQDELKTIKQIMKKQKMFAKSIKQKEEKLELWLEEKRIEDEQMRKKQIIQKCQIRKKEMKIQREQIEKKKQERQIQYELQIQKLKELKEKKYLHQKLSEQCRTMLEENMAQKIKQYQAQKQRRKNAVSNIEIHQKQYIQRKKALEEKRQKQFEDSLAYSKSELPFIHSKFFFTMKKQEQEHAKIQQWQRQMKQNNLNKRKLFSKQVKELFLPKLNTNNKLVIKKEESKKKILNHSQQHQLGNEYMKHVHGNIPQEKILKERRTLQEPPQLSGGYSAFYKNYLKDIKESHIHRNQKINSEVLKNVLDNPDLPEDKKLKTALKMLQKRDRQISKNKNAELIDSIKSKMLILNQMVR